ncbi:hypothetical protein [Krasilnikovia sp. MM14-A1259]|uniref:hypothetical protein n=1 Tax=Krasilnikovia sp. MM14-A1259 TaxID=3373539 RepID=UPI00399C8A86
MAYTEDLTFQAQGDLKLSLALFRLTLLRVWGVISLVVFAVAALLVWADLVPTMGVVFFGVVWVPLVLYSAWTNARHAVQQNSHKLGRPIAYRIDSTGIHATTVFDATEVMPWSTITGVTRTRGQIILWRGWRSSFGIPSGGFSSVEQDRLLKVLRSRGQTLVATEPPD